MFPFESLCTGTSNNYQANENACALAYGAYYQGSPDNFGHATRGGLSVGFGRYTVQVPVYLANRRLRGVGTELTSDLACTLEPHGSAAASPWLGVGYGVSGKSKISGITFDGRNNRATHALHLDSISLSNVDDVEGRNAISHGIYARRCQSMMSATGWLAVDNGGNGIHVEECNALHGSNWRSSDNDGDGVYIKGDYDAPPPWEWGGGMSIAGVTVERCARGLVIEDCIKAVHIGGILWVEAVDGVSLRISNARAYIPAISLQTNGTDPCLEVVNGGALYTDNCYIGSPAAGVKVDSTSRIYGSIYSYPGATIVRMS